VADLLVAGLLTVWENHRTNTEVADTIIIKNESNQDSGPRNCFWA
jgi:hypothetical protein